MYRNSPTCSHLTNEHSSLLDVSQLKNKPYCSKCGYQGPNLWICLHRKCMEIGCSDQLSDHSTIHFESDSQTSYQLQHCIHLNLSTQRAWCFLCEREISLGGGGNRRRPAYVGETPATMKTNSSESNQANKHNNYIDSGRKNYFSGDENCDGMESDSELSSSEALGTGLVGLQNIANTCYMNSALQALSNIWPMTHYFLNCSDLLDHALEQGTNRQKSNGLAKSYQRLICDMWRKRGPMVKGYITPRGILYGIRGVHPMFRGFQQHDTQEFLRCFMDQLHEELKEQVIHVPAQKTLKTTGKSSSMVLSSMVAAPPPSTASSLVANACLSAMSTVGGQNVMNDDDAALEMSSCSSSVSIEETEGEFLTCDSSLSEPLSICDEVHQQQQQQHQQSNSSPPLSPNTTLTKSANQSPQSRTLITSLNKSNNSTINHPNHSNHSNHANIIPNSYTPMIQSTAITTTTTLSSNGPHHSAPNLQPGMICTNVASVATTTSSTSPPTSTHSIISDIFDGKLLSSVQCLTCDRVTTREETFQDLSLPIPNRDFLNVLHQNNSLSSQSLNSIESTTMMPGALTRSPSAAAVCGVGSTGSGSSSSGLSASSSNTTTQSNDSWIQWIWNLIRSWIWGPSITIHDCMSSFFSADELKGDNMYSCEKCNKLRTGIKYSRILDLPEVLCIHLKRFRHDLSYSSKISSYVEFPLESFDMRPYLHKDCHSEISLYNLSSVICHHGTVGGGHYTCYARNTFTDRWYEYDDHNVHEVHAETVQNCQAYVLFYHKCNPKMESIRFEANEVSCMHPLNQSDIHFFISRDWLARFNTFGEPGPINNWSILCPHGGILQSKIAMMSQLAVPISQSLWEFLHQKFGGGPVINMLFECETCKRMAETLARRQAYEHSFFTRFNGPDRELYNSGTIYAVSMSWLRKWQQFARGQTSKEPGPINNGNIVSTTQNSSSMNSNNMNIMDDEMIIVVGDHDSKSIGGVQKTNNFPSPIRNVRIGSDYAQLCAPLWRFLHGIYGGGPEVILRPALDDEIEIIDQDELNAMQNRYKQHYVGDNDNLMNGGDNYGEFVSSVSDTESSIGHNQYQSTFPSVSNNEHNNMDSDIDNRNQEIMLVPLTTSEIPMSSDKCKDLQQQQVEQPLILDQDMDYCLTNDDQRSLLNGEEENLAQTIAKPQLQIAASHSMKYPEIRNQHYRYHHQHYNHHYQQRHQPQSEPQHAENARKTVRNKVLSKSMRRKMKRMRHDLRQPDIFGVKGNYSSVNGLMELQEQHSNVDVDNVHDLVDHFDGNGDDDVQDNTMNHDNDIVHEKSNCHQHQHQEHHGDMDHRQNDHHLKTTNAFNDEEMHLMNNIHNEFYKKITIPSTIDDDDHDNDDGGSGKPMRSNEQQVTNNTLNASEKRFVNGIGGCYPNKRYNYLENCDEGDDDDGDNDADDDDDERNNNGIHYSHSNHKYAKQPKQTNDHDDDQDHNHDDDNDNENNDAAVECPQMPFAVDTKDEWCHHQLITTNKKHHRIVKTKPLLIIKKYQPIKMDETMNDSSLETDV